MLHILSCAFVKYILYPSFHHVILHGTIRYYITFSWTYCLFLGMLQLTLVESQLKFKLDIRSIKQHFLNLLKNFEAFEQRNPEWESYAQQEQSPLKQKASRRTIGRVGMDRKSVRSTNPARKDYSREYKTHRSSGLRHSANPCPNNTEVYGKSLVCPWGAPLLGSNDTAELASVDYSKDEPPCVSMLSDHTINHINLSNITKDSMISSREQFSQSNIADLTGPLTSTMSYPQYSTPEKQKRRYPEEGNNTLILKGNSARRLFHQEERPAPAGINSQSSQPLHHFIQSTTDSDSTPVATRVKRFSDLHALGQAHSSDSALCGPDTPSTVVLDSSNPITPRLSINGGSSSLENLLPSSKQPKAEFDSISTGVFWDMDQGNKLRRQTATHCLNDEELRSPVGLSDTDLIDASSFFDQTNAQCSLVAMRASVAQLSSLSDSLPSSNSPPSADVTISTCVDSSYKESDATSASSPLPSRRHAAVRQTATSHYRQNAPSNTTSSMSALSQYTSTSSYGGLVAPMNSPNVTTNCASPPCIPVINETSSNALHSGESPLAMSTEEHHLGARPPCVGGEPMKQSATARLHLSDPTPHSTNFSGASSDNLPSMPDKCPSSDSSKEIIKGSSSSGSDSATSPRKIRSKVRRSLSKRIKKLGKHLLRGHSKSKADPHNSA